MNDDYAAFVFEDQKKTDQEKYEAVVYNKTGRKLMSHKFSSEYNKLLLGEKELLLAGNYHCSIVNFAGHEMFKKDFKKTNCQYFTNRKKTEIFDNLRK